MNLLIFLTIIFSPISLAQTEKTPGITKDSCEKNGYIFKPKITGCYKIQDNENEKKSWIQARNDCLKDDADLLIISSYKEQRAITRMMKNKGIVSTWLGIKSLKNAWITSDGKPFNISVLVPANITIGKNKCILLSSEELKSTPYLVDSCKSRHSSYICEKKPGDQSSEHSVGYRGMNDLQHQNDERTRETVSNEIGDVKNQLLEVTNNLNKTIQKNINDFKNDISALNSSLNDVKQVQKTILKEIENIKNQNNQEEIKDIKNDVNESKQVQKTITEEIEGVEYLTTESVPVNSNTTIDINAKKCQDSHYTYVPKIGCHKIFDLGLHNESEKKNWIEARKACHLDGADLVVINSEEELRNILGMVEMSGAQHTWIGIYEKEGHWVTTKEEHVTNGTSKVWFPKNYPVRKNACIIISHLFEGLSLVHHNCVEKKVETFICEIME